MSKKPKPKPGYCTVTDAAKFMRRTPRRLQQMFVEEILPEVDEHERALRYPYDDAGTKYFYCKAFIAQAYIAHLETQHQGGKSASEAREAKTHEETRWLRTRNLEKEKALMPVALHKQIQSAVINASKSRYLATPSRILAAVPSRCPHCEASLEDVRQAVTEIAKQTVTEALQELSGEKLELTETGDRRPETEPAVILSGAKNPDQGKSKRRKK